MNLFIVVIVLRRYFEEKRTNERTNESYGVELNKNNSIAISKVLGYDGFLLSLELSSPIFIFNLTLSKTL